LFSPYDLNPTHWPRPRLSQPRADPRGLLASACLPTFFQAIEIDGEAYWDGGYTGNPTITPLVQECVASDTLLVQVNPIERPGTPRGARDIPDRLNEVSFNATLLKELRMMAVLRQVSDPGNSEGARWAQMRIHRIASPMMTELGYSSKLNGEWSFLCMLRDEDRRCAAEFLHAHKQDIGHRSTLDIDDFLEPDATYPAIVLFSYDFGTSTIAEGGHPCAPTSLSPQRCVSPA
jgi:NTE family protein